MKISVVFDLTGHTLRVKSMHWKNIRNFEQLPNARLGDSRIELNQSPHSLLQIQNNYGKTTTMHLLRSVFTGNELESRHLQGYGYRHDTTEWGGDKHGIGSFQVFFILDGEEFAIETVIDPVNKTQRFFTYRNMVNGTASAGRREGWQPPAYFSHLFSNKPDFVDLFVLDGEKARDLNSKAGNRDKIGVAIRQVTGLMNVCDLIDEGSRKGRISEIVVNVLSKEIGTSGNRSKNLENTLNDCLDWKRELEERATELHKEIMLNKNKLDSTIRSLDKYDEDKMKESKRLKSATNDLEKAKKRLTEATKEVMRDMFNPGNVFSTNLWEDVKLFYNSQIQGKMPKGMTKNWFNEIMNNHPHCICGTEWTSDMKDFIDANKEDFLDELLMPRVKTMQTEVVNSQNETTLEELRRKIDAHRVALLEAQKSVRDLRDEFPEDEKLAYENLISQRVEIELIIKDLQLEYDYIKETNRDFIKQHDLDRFTLTQQEVPVITSAGFSRISNIFELEKVENYLRSKLLASTESAVKAKGAEILKDVLSESIEILLNEIYQELEVKMNATAQKMAGLNSTIKITNSGLQFRNPAGEIQEKLNEAGELGAIYGLVACLNAYSDVSMPIIVDTPLAGFGMGMVKSWTDVVPGSFAQTIALINSAEKRALQFWWQQNHDDIKFYTFLRENENYLTGRDTNWREDAEQPTTGQMYVSSEYEVFSEYESQVGGN